MRGFSTFVAVALVGIISTVSASAEPKYVGCYEKAGKMKMITVHEGNSRGICADACKSAPGDGYATMAMTKGTQCWCGQTLPNRELAVDTLLVDQSKCKQPCPGFGDESCGERLGKYFSIYTTGLEERPDEDPLPSSTTSTSSKTSTSSSSADKEEKTSAAASSAPASAETSTESDTKKEESGGVNKAAVAAGCVIAVLVIIGISIGAFLIMRKRRRAKVEEDFRRSAAVREFSQKPSSDHRLDPGMVQKRDSVGSIADNQDYSRRILKVTNPDGN